MLTHTHICIPQYLVEVLRQVGRTGGVGNTSWMTVPAGSYWVRQVMVKETRIEWSRLAHVNNHRAIIGGESDWRLHGTVPSSQ